MEIKLFNYHIQSMKLESKYLQELLVMYDILLHNLQQYQDPTIDSTANIIDTWINSFDELTQSTVATHVEDVQELVNDIVPPNYSNTNPTDNAKKLEKANLLFLNNINSSIKDQVTELLILKDYYHYSEEMLKPLWDKIIKDIYHSLELFAVMSTIEDVRQLLFDNAQSQNYTEYQWLTQMDNRVRPKHQLMQDKWVRFDDPRPQPAGYHVGMDYGCRCFMGALR